MIKQLIQFTGVLAITLFLAPGCASTIVNEGPFDFSVMREMEDAGQMFGRMANVVPISDEARNQYDMAWSKYHAGQVAVAQGKYEEARKYFKAALDELIEAITTVQVEALMAPPVNPSLSF